MSKVKKYVLEVLIGFGLIACNTGDLEFDNIEVQPIAGTFAVPLGDISYTIRELIEEQSDSVDGLVEDSTSFLSLYYTDSITYNAQNDFVDITDIDGGDTLDITRVNGGNPVAGPQVLIIPTENFSIAYENEDIEEELDSVYYSGGELVLTVNSNAESTLNYEITFQNTLNQNTREPVVFNGTINGAGSDTQAQNLTGYYTRLLGDDNIFTLTFDGDLDVQNGQTFTGDEIISFDFIYQDQTFHLIYGKLGQDSVAVGNEAINIDFFENSGDEGFFFGAPVFRFNFENSFGVPVATDFSGIFSEDESGSRIFLEGDITLPNQLPEVLAADEPGTIKNTVIEINRSNSTISQLLSNSPTRLVFNVDAISNYYDQTQSNFVQPGNEISAFIEVEIPLEIRLENYQQSFGYDLNEGLDTDNIDSAALRILTINELPFSGSLSMEIQDSIEAVLYAVPEVLVFSAPFIDRNGLVTDPSGASADIPLPKDAIDALSNGARIEMIVTLNTPVSQTSRDILVKILADYKLEIKVGVAGTVIIDI